MFLVDERVEAHDRTQCPSLVRRDGLGELGDQRLDGDRSR